MPKPSPHEALAREIMAKKSDFYAVLQVDRTADEKEIRRSYYKLSLKLHPDKNPGNETTGAAYRIVNHCYEVLTDSNKRGLYDMYGEEGLERFSRFGEEFPPVSDILKFAVTFWAYLVVRRAGLRSGCSEVVDEVFPETAAASASVNEDTEAAYLRHQAFAKAHAKERRSARQQGRRLVATLCVLVCLLTGVNRYIYPIFGGASGVARGSPPPVLSEAERMKQLQAEQLFPPAHQPLARGANKKAALPSVTATPVSVKASCLVLPHSQDAVDCHAATSADSDAPKSISPSKTARADTHDDFNVQFLRYSGGEDDTESVLAFHAHIWDRCENEALLARASRDRFEATTALLKKGPLPAPRSPNKATSRKYAEKRWRPKFSESYSVGNKHELFEVSPLCSRLFQTRGKPNS